MRVDAYSHTTPTYASKNLSFSEIFEKELDATSAVLDTVSVKQNHRVVMFKLLKYLQDPSHMLLKARQLSSASDVREAHAMFLSDIFVHV